MQHSTLRSLAIVCDYMETTLFAIVCDLRFAIRDRLRSSAIIWKPALSNSSAEHWKCINSQNRNTKYFIDGAATAQVDIMRVSTCQTEQCTL